MNLLLAFLPFIVFVVAERLFGIPAGLAGGAATAAVLLVRDLVTPGRGPRLLEIGTFLLFGLLSLYALATGAPWSPPCWRCSRRPGSATGIRSGSASPGGPEAALRHAPDMRLT